MAYRPVLDLSTQEVAGFEARPYSACPELPTAKALLAAADACGRSAELASSFRERALAHAPRARLFVPMRARELDGLFFASDDDPLFHHPQGVVLQVAPRDAHGTLELSRELVHVLRSRGVGIGFSDFGGTRSSIGDVLDFRPTVVKLDRQLLTLAATARGRRYFAAIIAWASEVGVLVSARVETETQLDLVRSAGVRWADGPMMGPILSTAGP